MVKILAQAGNSLADIYNVVGSIAGIETLVTNELPIVHEMGATVFSERYNQFIRDLSSGSILQSVNFEEIIEVGGGGPVRINAVSVFVSVTARIAFCSLALRDSRTGREIPIWTWDETTDIETRIRFSDDGAAVGTVFFLQPNEGNVYLPNMASGGDQRLHLDTFVFRGQSTAFGAGNITADCLVETGFAHLAGIGSRGLPMPGW